MTAQTQPRPGRNEPCHCGSGRKYKHCCLAKDEAAAAEARTKAAAEMPAEAADMATTAPASTRAPKSQTHQPWRSTTSRGFVPAVRTPRKAGGS
ncbi:MAG: SEC-C metal-binding domain-containing protein [Acidobacteriota bacterium]